MPLGCSSVEVSALGLGTAAIGGLYTPVTPDEAAWWSSPPSMPGSRTSTLPRCTASASRNAPRPGLGRRRPFRIDDLDEVGRLIEPSSGGGTDVFAGVDPADIVLDFSAEGVHRSLEASLERLGLDRVDVVFVHDPDDRRSGDRRDLPGAGALARRGRRRSASA